MDDTVNKGAYRKAFGITTEAMSAAIPLRRMGIPQDIAEIVGFLVVFPGCQKGMASSRNTVLVVQRDDRFVTRDLLTNAILRRFGRARITSISNAGHWPHLEQPAATAKAIDGFLAEIGWSHAR